MAAQPAWVVAHCTGWHICCALGVTAIEQVRDLWPMPPQTEQRCGLFLREECPLAGREPSGAIGWATPMAVPCGRPDRARCTIFFVPCSWLIALVSWSRSSMRLRFSGSSWSICRMRSRWAVHDWSDASRLAAESSSVSAVAFALAAPSAAAAAASAGGAPSTPSVRCRFAAGSSELSVATGAAAASPDASSPVASFDGPAALDGAGAAAAGVMEGWAPAAGIWTSKTSKHSPHCTEVRACLRTAWSSALQDGHENWYVDSMSGGGPRRPLLRCALV
mmetsp:Transcript_8830/g.17944  ORF Transcript_8830/g.17944 Transcript_8830/m.17944 type:complete len:277 (-) Transcript_8830:8-838(-)